MYYVLIALAAVVVVMLASIVLEARSHAVTRLPDDGGQKKGPAGAGQVVGRNYLPRGAGMALIGAWRRARGSMIAKM
jgi:hypothetical protein